MTPMRSSRLRRLIIAAAVVAVAVAAALAFLLPRVSPWYETRPAWWAPGAGGDATLSVMVVGAGPGHGVRVKVADQTATTVRLRVWVEHGSNSTALGYPTVVEVALKAPLGQRQVVDKDGIPVPRDPG